MPPEKEIAIIQKATVYDLIDIIERNEEKTPISPEEIKALMKAYITGATQN